MKTLINILFNKAMLWLDAAEAVEVDDLRFGFSGINELI